MQNEVSKFEMLIVDSTYILDDIAFSEFTEIWKRKFEIKRIYQKLLYF